MKFEQFLAKRYISSQKRHAALTICSIIIAIALMTMLFTSYTTLNGIGRAASYDSEPYHMCIYKLTASQSQAVQKLPAVESCKLRRNPDGKTYYAELMFSGYIGEQGEFAEQLKNDLKIEGGFVKWEDYAYNSDLMGYDLTDLDGRFNAIQMFALFFVLVLFIAASLRLIIDTAFEVSSKERERQFGMLQSIGATPQQIVRVLTTEGLILSAIGVPVGAGFGILLGYAAYKAVLTSGVAEVLFTTAKAEELVHFHVNPWMTLASAVVGLCWVMFSAYGTGMRIIRKSPVQAITARENKVKKVKKFTLLSLFFGWTGKLASRNARRRFKRFVITVLSLTLSITLYAVLATVMNGFEKGMEQALAVYSMFGVPYNPDFTLHISSGMERDPLAYAEPLKRLENTGYFKDVMYIHGENGELSPDSYKNGIYYVSEATYRMLFGDDPSVSFAELSASGGAVLVNAENSDISADTKQLTLNVNKSDHITAEEYEAHVDENGKVTEGYKHISTVDNIDMYWYNSSAPATFAIVGEETFEFESEYADTDLDHAFLILSEQTYHERDYKLYGDFCFGGGPLDCSLASESDYELAKHFLEENAETYHFEEWSDIYADMKTIRTVLSAVRIGVTFIIIMVALIAIVNMVNVVSTGILNRKQELAAMQCIGMTRGQMYRMTVIECLTFALWAAVASTILCFLLIYGTEQMLIVMTLLEDMEEKLVSYTEPLPKIWIASAAAFLVTLLASVFPLRNMQKEPLIDQIRAVE